MDSNWDGISSVAFGAAVTYSCHTGYMFLADIDRTSWDVTCQTDGQFLVDPGMVCVQSTNEQSPLAQLL